MRHGIPWATSSLSQEMAITTGVLDGRGRRLPVHQPAIADVAARYHTKVITTMHIAKMPGAIHMEFSEEQAKADRPRDPAPGHRRLQGPRPGQGRHPRRTDHRLRRLQHRGHRRRAGHRRPDDPLKPLVDNIVNGNILGVCLFAGCNDVKVTQDENFIDHGQGTGQGERPDAGHRMRRRAPSARHGIMSPSEAVELYAGDGLKAVLTAIGEANGLGGPLPLVLHMGSCVDNTRAADVAVAVANYLGVDLDKLPVVATAPEAAMEKAVSIGTWAVAMGLPTHVGIVPPVLGSPAVAGLLTGGLKDVVGGWFIVETDPVVAARKLVDAIVERRVGLGLPVPEGATVAG